MLRIVVYSIVAFLLLPMIVVVIASVTTTSYLVFPPQGFTLKWYAVAAANEEWVASLKTSALIAAVAAVIASVLGGLAAIGLTRYAVPAKSALDAVFLSPLILPSVAIGVAFIQAFAFVGISRSFVTLVLGHVLITMPYVIRLVRASVAGVDVAFEKAASSLGASPLRTLWHVTLPLIRPGVLAGAVFAFIVSFDNVTVSVFLSTPYIIPLPIRIFSALGFPIQPDLIAISSMLIIATAIAIVVIERTISVRRLFQPS